eukprot:1195699-Prorocentrum_minimum.AAC.4
MYDVVFGPYLFVRKARSQPVRVHSAIAAMLRLRGTWQLALRLKWLRINHSGNPTAYMYHEEVIGF